MKKNLVMRKISLITVMMVMMLCILSACGGKKEAFRVVMVENLGGDVSVSSAGGDAREVVQNMHLVAEDLATVASESYMTLSVDDDKFIKIDDDSQISVDAAGDRSNGKVTVRLVYGHTNIKILNKLQEKDSFEVETNNATMAVRGTEFDVYYDPSTDTTKVSVVNGTVEVIAHATGQSIYVNEGDTVNVVADSIVYEDAENSAANLPSIDEKMWKEYADKIVGEKKAEGLREIDIKSVADYENFCRSGNINDAILYFDSKTYDFTNSEYEAMDVAGMKNVTFVGTGDTKIISQSGFDEIVIAYDNEDITFYGMIFGHEITGFGGCSAGVIQASSVKGLKFISCDIYGCGITGASIYAGDVAFLGSIIRDCSYNALEISGESSVVLEDCLVSGNDYHGSDAALFQVYLYNGANANLTLDKCVIKDNKSTSLINPDVMDGFNLIENNCTYSGNNF